MSLTILPRAVGGCWQWLRVIGIREPESNAETALALLALIGFEDPPRPGVAEALAACRRADIKVAMITGDHRGTAAVVAREVGLLGQRGVVLDASQLPEADEELAS